VTRARLARATPVRYAVLFALCSALLMGVLLGVIYWWMSTLLARHLDESIDTQLQVLRTGLAQDGRDSMLGLVREHEKKYGDSSLHFLVQDASGAVLAGDLPPTQVGEGWHDIALMTSAHGPDDRRRLLRGRGEWLAEDLFVLVTNDTQDLRQTRILILGSFAAALAGTVVLALGGGLIIGRTLLRRVDAVNQTARAIMAGDLSQRIPVVGVRDELGGLAEILNQMLGRIEELMANVQHVTSDIAHDLRTPLGRQRQRLESALNDPATGPECRSVIEAAIDETDTMLKRFEAILRIAQIEAGARRARFSTVDLSSVAENVADAFAAVAEDEGRRLETEIEPGLSVHGDGELLTQLLANLVENGLRHTPAGTVLTTRLIGSADRVRLEVTDNGAGIPEEERTAVLGRFYRLDRSRSTPGSGLGLSLVAAVAKLHGARISLEDNEPGLRVVLEFERHA
jgi:signal transduction histidine kinase